MMRIFFFYGTLVAGSGNEVERRVHASLRPIGSATMHGRLYAIPDPEGWYPGLLRGTGVVRGMAYCALPSFCAADLAEMDAYEGFSPSQPRQSLYVRKAVAIRGEDGCQIEAQAYLFNQPLPPGARRIASGDFHGWLARTGHSPYGCRQARRGWDRPGPAGSWP
ncbi:MAG: gamma-glutamylcyclotransferase [Novosphingobium sp.]|nr:gamma-glutamylcyclotransferase [Novosphingobium sp.]